MSDLYETDVVAWSERQAELLRQHAATARANDAIDWPNIIQEIESVRSEQRFAVESNLMQALIHRKRSGRTVRHFQPWPPVQGSRPGVGSVKPEGGRRVGA